MSYVKEMEQHLDANIRILRQKISTYASKNEGFDLKKALHYYVIDTLGELAFSQTFGLQVSNDEARVPPVIEHSLLAAVTGAWPSMTARLKRWLPLIPHSGLRALFQGRKACAELASRCVNTRLSAIRSKDGSEDVQPERKDILTNLILAKHPDTGESLSQTDLETEAFGFMYVLLESGLGSFAPTLTEAMIQYRRNSYYQRYNGPTFLSSATQSRCTSKVCCRDRHKLTRPSGD